MDRELDDIIGEELESEQALPACPNIQWRPWATLRCKPHALPWVLVQVSHADVEDGTADQVDPIEADAIHLRQIWQKHVVAHACRPQGLLPIPYCGVDELDAFHGAT